MNITITGASGFLGQKLAHGLLSANALTDSAGSPSRVEHLTLLDVVKPSNFLVMIPSLSTINVNGSETNDHSSINGDI